MNQKEAVLKLREVLKLRHLSLATEDAYVGWLIRYSRFISERCHEAKPRREMVYCDICRQWFCEGCYKSDHVWQCAED